MSPKEPLVSIITPAYNTGRFIEAAIRSVIGQSWSNWELIIVNDGSTDRTAEICQHFCDLDQRIRLINSANKGVSHARNLGLMASTGEFIAFLDSDDYLAQDYLSRLVGELLISGADIAASGIVHINSELSTKLKKVACDYFGSLLGPLTRFDPRVFHAVFYVARSESIKGVYFEEGLTNSEDLLFWLTCCSRRRLIYRGIEQDGYFYRQSINSASRNIDAWAKAQSLVLRRAWALDFGLFNKLILTVKILRQLASYHVKKKIGVTIERTD